MAAGRAGASFNSWLVTSIINVASDVLGGFNRPRSCALPVVDCADSSRAFLQRQTDPGASLAAPYRKNEMLQTVT